jgi:hypothetical protein
MLLIKRKRERDKKDHCIDIQYVMLICERYYRFYLMKYIIFNVIIF